MKKLNKFPGASIGTAVLAAVLFLAAGPAAANQPVAEFLRLSGSARVDGMAGAYTARGANADGVSVNPASLHGLQRLDAYFTFFELMDSTTYFRGYIGDNFGKYGTFGVNVSNISSGSIQGTTANSFGDVESNGTFFGVSGQAYALTWAHSFLWDMATGISVKVIREDFSISQETMVAVDLGVQKTFFKDKLMTGISFLNLGPPVSRGDSGRTDNLPMMARFGLGYTVLDVRNHEVVVLTDTSLSDDLGFQVQVGAEYKLFEMIYTRVGLFPNSPNENFAAGLGLHRMMNQTHYSIDYTMQSNKFSGLSNRITVQASWEPETARRLANVRVQVILKDGSVLVGRILEQSNNDIVVDVVGQGKATINRDKIEDIKKLPEN
jgi:hypothetical protein